jgi:hypothetical protein
MPSCSIILSLSCRECILALCENRGDGAVCPQRRVLVSPQGLMAPLIREPAEQREAREKEEDAANKAAARSDWWTTGRRSPRSSSGASAVERLRQTRSKLLRSVTSCDLTTSHAH